MILPQSLFVLFLSILDTPAPSYAFSPSRSLSSATERFHRYAKRKSARLARDLRIVFQAHVEQADAVADSQKIFCTRPDGLSNVLGNATATSPATATGAAANPTATSPYKLVEEHVCLTTSFSQICLDSSHNSLVAAFLMVGHSGIRQVSNAPLFSSFGPYALLSRPNGRHRRLSRTIGRCEYS